tara:strand:- start:609 stop:1715 length:1107 start_codon:yes stop_codon:yes gene_type:complete
MNQVKLNVKTSSHKYSIIIGKNLCSKITQLLKTNKINYKKIFIIIDRNVPKSFVSALKKSLSKKKKIIYYFNASEKNKNMSSVNKILQKLLNKNFSREDCLISVGGGITGDVAGFVASLFKRGIKFINLPTTLLSQVDSSIGGKTGVNTKFGKNLIGSFYQPNLVISDINFLKTLPKRELICGYGEILKHSLIGDKKFYNFLNKNIKSILKLSPLLIKKAIYESCKIKKRVVEKDENEKGLRKILNFGHTFAHAYEATLNYNKKLNHGEAVILGMNTALNFSYQENMIKKKEFQSILDHINTLSLPISINNFFSPKDLKKILSYMTKDKKNNSNKISLVLLKRIGRPIINKEYSKKTLGIFLKKFLRN